MSQRPSNKSSKRRFIRLRDLPVLIVDDLDLDRKLMRVVLAGEGCDVRVARNSDEAETLMRTFRPRIIVMDVRMPAPDGLQLTRRLKAAPETKDIVIVAVTAYNGEGNARAAGCDGFIDKPIDVATFAEQILAVLSRSQGRRTR